VVLKGPSGSSALVCSGDQHVNRSPPLPRLSARRRCYGVARAVDLLCCRFLCYSRALTIPGKRVSGQNQCALLRLP
jgi:hypothetical protein